MKGGEAACLRAETSMAERSNFRLLVKHRNEMEVSRRNWVSAVLEILIALGFAFLGGYAAYCFMTKFGE